jgi:hypothetical protein
MCKLKKVRDESKPQWVGGKKKEDFPEITGKVRTKREDRWFVPGFKLLPLYQDKGTPEQENPDGDQMFLQSKMLIRSNNQFRNYKSEFSRI